MLYALDGEDFLTSLSWLNKSAKQNNVEAQYNLGVYYERGYGVPKNLDKAKEWYQLAANQGLEQAIEKVQELEKTDSDTDQSLSDTCLLYTSPSPRDRQKSRMPSSA